MDNPLCYAPFNLISIDFDSVENSGQPIFGPCCVYSHKTVGYFPKQDGNPSLTVNDYLNSNQLAQLKQTMLSEKELPPACINCQSREKVGLTSFREIYKHNIKFQNKLLYVEFSLDNQCNMACWMCVPKSSTTLSQEYVKINQLDRVIKLDNYDLLDSLKSLPNNLQLNLAGGEPFMSRHFNDLMDIVLDKQWSVSLVTNCSLINNGALERLKQCKDLKIDVSMDGVNDLYEIMRWPNSWSKFNQVFDIFKAVINDKSPLELDTVKGEPLSKQK